MTGKRIRRLPIGDQLAAYDTRPAAISLRAGCLCGGRTPKWGKGWIVDPGGVGRGSGGERRWG
jgi:hypothetical protein